MYIAWTTVGNAAEGEALAAALIERRLAACVQIDGPIVSYYHWDGQTERAEEFRLSIKCAINQLEELEQEVLRRHPYETPEWMVVRADRVGEKYLSWATPNSTTPPL